MNATANTAARKATKHETTFEIGPEGTSVVITRIFDAPPALVYRAFTDPALIPHWYGPRYLETIVDKLDLRPGGEWRFINRDPSGEEYGFHGVFLELAPPRFIKQSWVFEGMEGAETIETATFEDLGDGRTKYVGTSEAGSREAVEGMLASGMIEGAIETYDRLEEILADSTSPDRSFILRRTLNAPRELVWKAWTDPALLVNWWGPSGFTNTFHSIDIRPGGEWRFTMHGPDGVDWPNLVIFDEVVEPDHLTFMHGSGTPEDLGMFYQRVTFTGRGDVTHVTMQATFDTLEEKRAMDEFGAVEGGNQTLDRLEAQLADMQATPATPDWSAHDWGAPLLSRTFAAPRDLLWKSITEPERLIHWWGPTGLALKIYSLDLRPGGLFHYTSVANNGAEMCGRFVYHVIAAPERLEFVTSFADAAGEITRAPFSNDWPLEIYNIWTLSEAGDHTTLTLRGGPIHATPAEQAMYESFRSSMREGFGGTFAQLDAYLATL